MKNQTIVLALLLSQFSNLCFADAAKFKDSERLNQNLKNSNYEFALKDIQEMRDALNSGTEV